MKKEPTKTCCKCKNTLPNTNEYFYCDKYRNDGLSYICIKCTKEKKRIEFHSSKKREIESLENEIWEDVTGYEGLYKVSNLGRILSLNGNYKILKQNIEQGYFKVRLFKNKKMKCYSVHRLVAKTFIANPNNYPVVNHKDEDKLNNNVENLEWCTEKYNINYGTGIQRRIDKAKIKVYQYDMDLNLIKIWDSAKDASEKLDIDDSAIGGCCKGKFATYKDFMWSYTEIDSFKGNIKKKKVYQYDKDYNLIKVYEYMKLVKENGFCVRIVSAFCNGKYKYNTYKGYIWSFESLDGGII